MEAVMVSAIYHVRDVLLALPLYVKVATGLFLFAMQRACKNYSFVTLAVIFNQVSVLRLLLSLRFDASRRDGNGASSLLHAARLGRLECLLLLIYNTSSRNS